MTFLHTKRFGQIAFLAAFTIAVPGFAATSFKSTILGAGQTTQDGELTLVVNTSVVGSTRVSLKNNDGFDVAVDSYTLSQGDPFACDGKNMLIRAYSTGQICTVRRTFENESVPLTLAASPSPKERMPSASLQMTLTWRRKPKPSPSPQS